MTFAMLTAMMNPYHGGHMAKIQSWEVSDSFWERVEPLIPKPERDPNKTYKRKAGRRQKADATAPDIRGHHVCAANRLPMEGFAQGTLWKPQCHPYPFHALDACRILCRSLALRTCRI